MDEQAIRQIIREELSFLIKNNKLTFSKPMQVLDGNDIVLGQGTGTRFGTSATQKLAFFGATPIIQYPAITTPNNQGATYNQTDVVSLKSAIDDLRAVVKNFGLSA